MGMEVRRSWDKATAPELSKFLGESPETYKEGNLAASASIPLLDKLHTIFIFSFACVACPCLITSRTDREPRRSRIVFRQSRSHEALPLTVPFDPGLAGCRLSRRPVFHGSDRGRIPTIPLQDDRPSVTGNGRGRHLLHSRGHLPRDDLPCTLRDRECSDPICRLRKRGCRHRGHRSRL